METIKKNKWKKLVALAKKGNAEAQWEVGYYYEEGASDKSGNLIVKINPSKALHWYTLSAEQGNHNSQLSLSNILSSRAGIEPDYETAIQWAKKAMKQGNASAAHNLGAIYRDLKKPAIAFRYYNVAVKMGSIDSLSNVGMCHLFGHGTKHDLDAAYNCFQRIMDESPPTSCQRTRENALYWMAIFNLMGICRTQRSVANARKMLESANADDDHEQANDILNIIGKTKYLRA